MTQHEAERVSRRRWPPPAPGTTRRSAAGSTEAGIRTGTTAKAGPLSSPRRCGVTSRRWGSSSGAACKVLSLFSNQELLSEPVIARVDEEVCAGCGYCVETCAYGAPALDPVTGKASVNTAICEGCGACAVACPSGAMGHRNFTARQFMELVENALRDY